jgi:hypothetical protein
MRRRATTRARSCLHELEGPYVGSHEVPPHHILHERKIRGAALRMDPSRPTRVIELIFTGSPIGKRYALDDAAQDVTLFNPDEDKCLIAMLARHHVNYPSSCHPTVQTRKGLSHAAQPL